MTAFLHVLAMALALASSSHPFESARNQYEAREDRPQPPQLLTEATDRPEVHLNKSDLSNTSNKTTATYHPELEVGYSDGFIQAEPEEDLEGDKNKLPAKATKRRIPSKQKRSYTPWSGQITYSVPYSSINIWQPPIYQLSRPYYVPIYGVAGRPPIYFPPQPLYINPGIPKDNPLKTFQGPPYLPPAESTTEPTTTMSVANRFNGGDNEDDRPIWDLGDNEVTQRPLTTTVVPTRRTRPPGVPKTHPPLIHGSSNSQQSASSSFNPPPPPEPRPVRPPTTIRTPIEPSRCVWAIISCCSTTGQVVYDCFEQRGCPGAFWDSSPCDSEFAKAAIAAALNYYEKK